MAIGQFNFLQVLRGAEDESTDPDSLDNLLFEKSARLRGTLPDAHTRAGNTKLHQETHQEFGVQNILQDRRESSLQILLSGRKGLEI